MTASLAVPKADDAAPIASWDQIHLTIYCRHRLPHRDPPGAAPWSLPPAGDGVLPGNLHGEVHRDQLDLAGAPGQYHADLDDEVQGRCPNMTLPDNFEMQVGL